MKKYISAILINAFLIQFIGCYSQRTITYDELLNSKDITDVSVFYNGNNKVKLTTDSLKYNYVKWSAEKDTLRVFSTYAKRTGPNSTTVISDTLYLSEDDITAMQVNEYDATKTIIVVLSSIAILAALIVLWRDNFSPLKNPGQILQ